MKTVWLLLQNLAAGWKNKKHIAFIIVLIIIMIGTICYVRKKGSIEAEPVKIVLGVAKEDTSEYADLLLQYFNENEVFLHYVELVEEEEESLKTALQQMEFVKKRKPDDAYTVRIENIATGRWL